MGVMGPFEQFLLIGVSGATICWGVYVLAGLLRRREQLRAASEFQMKLLDRAGSAHEFAEVLNSAAGLKLMEALATEREVRPQLRILRSFQLGLVMASCRRRSCGALCFARRATWSPIAGAVRSGTGHPCHRCHARRS